MRVGVYPSVSAGYLIAIIAIIAVFEFRKQFFSERVNALQAAATVVVRCAINCRALRDLRSGNMAHLLPAIAVSEQRSLGTTASRQTGRGNKQQQMFHQDSPLVELHRSACPANLRDILPTESVVCRGSLCHRSVANLLGFVWPDAMAAHAEASKPYNWYRRQNRQNPAKRPSRRTRRVPAASTHGNSEPTTSVIAVFLGVVSWIIRNNRRR